MSNFHLSKGAETHTKYNKNKKNPTNLDMYTRRKWMVPFHHDGALSYAFSACCWVNISVVLDTLNYIWAYKDVSCGGQQLGPWMRGFSKRENEEESLDTGGEGGRDKTSILPIDLLGKSSSTLVYPSFSHLRASLHPPVTAKKDLRLTI